MNEWLGEQLKTTINLCEISLILIEQKREELLPTVIELMHYYTQEMIDKNCITTDP